MRERKQEKKERKRVRGKKEKKRVWVMKERERESIVDTVYMSSNFRELLIYIFLPKLMLSKL